MKAIATTIIATVFATLGLGFQPISEAHAAPVAQLSATLDCHLYASRLVPAFPSPYWVTIEDGDVVPSGAVVSVGFAVANTGPHAANGLDSAIVVEGDHPRLSVLVDETYTNDVEDDGVWWSPAHSLSNLQWQDTVTVSVDVDAGDEFFGVYPGSPPASETCSLQFTVS